MNHICSGTMTNSGKFHDLTPKAEYFKLPSRVEHFIGRNVDMHNIMNLILSQRFITIKGIPGVNNFINIKNY